VLHCDGSQGTRGEIYGGKNYMVNDICTFRLQLDERIPRRYECWDIENVKTDVGSCRQIVQPRKIKPRYPCRLIQSWDLGPSPLYMETKPNKLLQ
jgi:hypothetical protein